jgi:ribosomal protein S6--L-glutamate ligase
LGPDFKSNLAQGGEIIATPEPQAEREALELVELLVSKTGLNLAAIDFLFREKRPLFNEINYVFGRRALGESFERYLFQAIREFLTEIGV